MRTIVLFIIIILLPNFVSGQDDTGILSIKTRLNDGVYTSVTEIVENNPKFEIAGIGNNANFWLGGSYFFTDQFGDEHDIQDSTIVIIVYDGKKLIHYGKYYGEIIQLGVVTTFLMNTMVHSDLGTHMDSDLHYWDMETGMMGRLSHKKAEIIIQRDGELYARYSSLGSGERKKSFYYYLLEYNKRNPVYMEE